MTDRKEELRNKERLTTEELGELLGIHKVTLCAWRVQGKGPVFVKAGSRVYYLMSDVVEWENANKQRSTAG